MRVAIVGEGVAGLSSALAIAQSRANATITVLSDRPFEKVCSYGPAGIFRMDNPKYRDIGKASFDRLRKLYQERNGDETGVKLLSGIIQSDNKQLLEAQETAYGTTVYNFRWLDERERAELCPNPCKYAIFFSTFASEAKRYIPYLRKEVLDTGRVKFEKRKASSLEELGDEYDVVVNCAGLDGGKLAGDDDTVFPVRGVALRVKAPWHKHFFYKDLDTFTIPMNDEVTLGSLKQEGNWSMEITQEDRDDIWRRYLAIHPSLKGAEVVAEWIALRPGRKEVRMELQKRKALKSGKEFIVLHNYGHGSNGFTLGWGCALEITRLLEEQLKAHSKL